MNDPLKTMYSGLTKQPVLILLALLPILVHITLVAAAISKGYYEPLRKPDLAVSVIALFYSVGIISTAGRKKRLINLTLLVYSLLFAIAGAELYLRFSSTDLKQLPFPPMHHTGYAAEGAMPGISGKIEFSVNKYGLRGPDVDLDKVDIRLLAVGGSTTESVYVTDGLNWTWRLQDKLSERLKKNVFVGSAGKSGNLTIHHIYLLQNYEWAPRFDWVIVLCGINDMGAFLRGSYKNRMEEVAEDTFATLTRKNAVYYKKTRIFEMCKLIFYRHFSGTRVFQDSRGLMNVRERKKRKKLLEKRMISVMPSGLNEEIRFYKKNLKKIIATCQRRNQNILMLTQPTMWRKGLARHLEGLLWQHIYDAAHTPEVLEEIMEKYNRGLIEVCEEEGVPYVDLASMLPKDDSVFYDDCHFNVSGSEKVAAILTEELARRYEER